MGTITVSDSFIEFIIRLLKRLFTRTITATLNVRFGMFVLKADHEDVPFTIEGEVTDSEGNVIDNADIDWAAESSNPSVVAINVDSDEDDTTGSIHIGSPGIASVNVVGKYNGAILANFGAQFTVVAGDPAAITGGKIVFEGIEEIPEEPTPE